MLIQCTEMRREVAGCISSHFSNGWGVGEQGELPESNAKRCPTEGKAFGGLVLASCAHTHTAH